MLTILPLNEGNCGKFNQVDARFLAGERVLLRVTHKGFALEYAPLPIAEWRTPTPFPADTTKLMAEPKAACYLAFVDGQCAGQSVIRLGAHQLCDLVDIRTDSRFRRQGVATQLVNACVEWALRAGRAGIRVETTDEQPVACQFFEKSGFTLGGVDRLWHAALPEQAKRVPATRESVLAFYKFFGRM